MSEVLDRIVANPLAAHQAIQDGWLLAKPLTIAGRKVRVLVEECEDDRTIQQNKFYWGPCLTEISEQANILGQKWAPIAWHELFKRQFLGYEIKKVKVAGRKKVTVIRRLRSTTKLKVKPMSVYLEKVQAFATTELGVRFSVANWQGYLA